METAEKTLLNSPELVISVDPGKSGAVVLMGRGQFRVLRDFKTLPKIAEAIHAFSLSQPSLAVMEFVHAMPGQGVCSMFSFGRASGVADGALAVSLPALPVCYVSPQKWQGWCRTLLGVAKDKEFDSRQIASVVCPWSTPYLTRKLDHNTADAILMAAWRLINPQDSGILPASRPKRQRTSPRKKGSNEVIQLLRAQRKMNCGTDCTEPQ